MSMGLKRRFRPRRGRYRVILLIRRRSKGTSTEGSTLVYQHRSERQSRIHSEPDLAPNPARKVILPHAYFVISRPVAASSLAPFQAVFGALSRDTAASFGVLELLRNAAPERGLP